MEHRIVEDYSSVIVKIEENIAVKTEVDSDTTENESIADKLGRTSEFCDDNDDFFKPTSRSETSKQNDRFVCAKCGREFAKNVDLEAHIIAIHRNEEISSYQRGCAFVRAIRVGHHNIEDGKFTKVYDSYPYNGSNRLAREIKPFVCEKCKKRYKYESGLKEHDNAIHNSLKRFACKECWRAFSYKAHFLSHMSKHAKAKEKR